MRNVLSEKAVNVNLSISFWTARKYDKRVTKRTNKAEGATDDAGRYTKRLVTKSATETIMGIVSEAKRKHYELTFPWIDRGPRILPTALYNDYANAMRELRQEFEAAADEFAKSYPAMVQKARNDLNGMFNDADYPADHEIRNRFAFDLKVLPCPDHKDFRTDLAKETAEDIANELQKEMQKALDEAMREPVRRIIEVVGHMAERVKAYVPANKKKGAGAENTFRDSLVNNVRELVDLLPKFNLTGDKALTQLTARIAHELCAFEPEELRQSKEARKSVAAAADEILAQAQAFMA